MSPTSLDPSCLQILTSKFEYLFEPKLIKDLCQLGEWKSFERNEVIIDFDQEVDFIPILISGIVRIITCGSEGEELLLYYPEQGDICLINVRTHNIPTKSKFRIISETNSNLLYLPLHLLEKWIVKFDSWRKYTLDNYNHILEELLSTIDQLAFTKMEIRIIDYLKTKVWITKSPILKITHSEIARDLNSSRSVISRLLKKLEKEGLFQQTRFRIEMNHY